MVRSSCLLAPRILFICFTVELSPGSFVDELLEVRRMNFCWMNFLEWDGWTFVGWTFLDELLEVIRMNFCWMNFFGWTFYMDELFRMNFLEVRRMNFCRMNFFGWTFGSETKTDELFVSVEPGMRLILERALSVDLEIDQNGNLYVNIRQYPKTGGIGWAAPV